jgi:hypothetical protein
MTNVNGGSGGASDKPEGSVFIGAMFGTFGENKFQFRLESMKDAIPMDVDAAGMLKLLKTVEMTYKERQMVETGWRLLLAKERVPTEEWEAKKEKQKKVWSTLKENKPSIFRGRAADERGAGGKMSKETQFGSCAEIARYLVKQTRMMGFDGQEYELRGVGWGESAAFEEGIKELRYDPLKRADDYAPAVIVEKVGPKRHPRVGIVRLCVRACVRVSVCVCVRVCVCDHLLVCVCRSLDHETRSQWRVC